MVIENDFDGVEIEYVLSPFSETSNWSFHNYSWEFPNQVEECNTFSPNDTKNYLAFLQALRKALGKGKTITAAVGVVPWTGPDGTPLTDVSDYADELDYICGLYSPLALFWLIPVSVNSSYNELRCIRLMVKFDWSQLSFVWRLRTPDRSSSFCNVCIKGLDRR